MCISNENGLRNSKHRLENLESLSLHNAEHQIGEQKKWREGRGHGCNESRVRKRVNAEHEVGIGMAIKEACSNTLRMGIAKSLGW